MQKKVTANVESYIKQADDLFEARDHFEKEVLARTNQKLYELLGGVLQLYLDMREKNHLKEALKVFAERLETKGMNVQRNTAPITVVLRYVFNSDRKRAHAYSKALLAAIDDGIHPNDLAEYIDRQGGIEEIKRNRSTNSQTVKKQEQLEIAVSEADQSLQTARSLATVHLGKDSVKLEDDTRYAFLIARKNSNGDLEAVAPVPRTTKPLETMAMKIIANKILQESEQERKRQMKEQEDNYIKAAARSMHVLA